MKYGYSVNLLPGREPFGPPGGNYGETGPVLRKTVLRKGPGRVEKECYDVSSTAEDTHMRRRRKSKNPTIFVVKAEKAHTGEIKLLDMGLVVLTKGLPWQYIAAVDEITMRIT